MSATFVRQVKEPGRYGDGRSGYGLYLRVHKSRNGRITKSWGQRLRIRGRVTNLGLGPYPVVTLAEAREKALENRRTTYRGEDPRGESLPTFAKVADKVIRLHSKTWKEGSRLPVQWRQTLRDYVLPVIGDKPVHKVTRADVLAIVEPIWHSKPATATRLLQRVGAVLRYAVAQGFIEVDVAEPEAIKAALPKANGSTTEHFKALPHAEVADMLARVRASSARPVARLALEYVILTAARPGEVVGARWDEIDLEAATWTVPRERMKSAREHRVPLSGRALEVLAEARQFDNGSGLIFPSKHTGRPLRTAVFGELLRSVGIDATAHGTARSSFRDWCGETGVDRAVAEAMLAHTVQGVEGAYARSDLLDRRRPLMEAWAAYVMD